MPCPRIILITTGGTIAAAGREAAATTVYDIDPARDPVRDLLPELARTAEVRVEAFANVPSHDLDVATVLELARRIEAHRGGEAADGIVVTHGTDTLEETAYLLDLVLEPGRPVVLTGAARPSSALSADGPLNLFNAVRVAACAEAAGEGVLVVFNDRITAARFVSKAHTSAPDAFRAGEGGHLGAITGDEIAFFAARRGRARRFPIGAPDDLPRVEIVYACLGMDARLIDAALAGGAAGIVIAATGNGSMPAAIKPALARARDAGVVVVRASRTGAGAVSADPVDAEYGTVPASVLNPQKARLLLMLSLRETRDPARIRAIFRDA